MILSARRISVVALAIVLMVAAVIGAALALGGPDPVRPLASINNPFKDIDYSDLPPLAYFKARDGSQLAYRYYQAAGHLVRGSVVLIHGSSASSQSMHVLAKQLAAAGFFAYALDMRGHGDSGIKGEIAYVGQLEDDVYDFMSATKPASPSTLVGLSAGGGFALRFASVDQQKLFQSYLLLSPFLGQTAPTVRPDSGGWASVGVPRIIALSLLNAAGIHAFNELPVMRFALNERAKQFLTPEYSYNLATNFRPHPDYTEDMRHVQSPCMVLAGADDELFFVQKFEPTIHAVRPDWPVSLLSSVGHTSLVVKPDAVSAIVTHVAELQSKKS